jgi:hypothetical protein
MIDAAGEAALQIETGMAGKEREEVRRAARDALRSTSSVGAISCKHDLATEFGR